MVTDAGSVLLPPTLTGLAPSASLVPTPIRSPAIGADGHRPSGSGCGRGRRGRWRGYAPGWRRQSRWVGHSRAANDGLRPLAVSDGDVRRGLVYRCHPEPVRFCHLRLRPVPVTAAAFLPCFQHRAQTGSQRFGQQQRPKPARIGNLPAHRPQITPQAFAGEDEDVIALVGAQIEIGPHQARRSHLQPGFLADFTTEGRLGRFMATSTPAGQKPTAAAVAVANEEDASVGIGHDAAHADGAGPGKPPPGQGQFQGRIAPVGHGR